MKRAVFIIAILTPAVFSMGCRRIVIPREEPVEREKAVREGAVFVPTVDKRPLPELSAAAPLPVVLEYAFNANGDLEAAYRDWRVAIERVRQAGALADPKVNFSMMLGAESLKTFSGFLEGVTAMLEQELPAPGKRNARAGLALREAQAAGERFRGAKYRLQKQVVQTYADLALNESLFRQTSETLRLLREAYEVASHRFHGMRETAPGGDLADLRKIEVEIQTVESEQRSLRIAHDGLCAALNGVLNRPTARPFGLLNIELIERPAQTDAELFARAVQHNPELAALRKEIMARGAAQVLAELERKPDYSVSAGMEQLSLSLGAGVTLPINRARIRAGIAESLAARQAAEARLRSAASDTQARVVLALAGIRDAERALEDYRERIVPKTQELMQTQITTYGSGGGDLLDILDTQRLLVEFRKLTLRAEADRLRFLAELEDVMGEDLFRFIPAPRVAGVEEDE